MRIGIDARILTHPEMRGMASYLMCLLKAWPDSRDIFVLFSEQMPDQSRQRDLNIVNPVEWVEVQSPRGTRLHIWDWWVLPRALAKNNRQLDVFWSPANLVFPLGNLPQVVTIHDTLLQEKVVFTDIFERWYYRHLIPFFIRWFSTRVITVSHFSAKRIHKVFNYPKKKIVTIHNGASLNSGTMAKEAVQKELNQLGVGECPYIYSLGAESPWKNTLGVLKAFDRVQKKHPNLGLVISGIQNRFEATLRAECWELGLSFRQVTLLGYVDSNIRDCLYAGASLFVYPSLFEGFGLPVLEAMSMGTPVVASNAASIPEVTGEGCVLTDAADPQLLADAIIHVLEQPELQKRLVVKGKKNINRFDWAVSASHHRKTMKKSAG
jgi:glycosyltransferase involved in cell wall biosynthesis